MTTIQDIARSQNMFPQANSTTTGNTVHLQLDLASAISYSTADNQYVINHPLNSPLSTKIGFTFKKFAEKIITPSELQTKIQKIIEKDRNPPPPSPSPVSGKSKMQEVMSEAFTKKVIDNEVECIKKAIGKQLLFFIGKSGTGKSTTTNLLLNCKMKFIDQKDLGSTSASKRIIIAENPVSKIGINPRKSKTSFPEIVHIPPEIIGNTNNNAVVPWTICDCPGFGENRGLKVEINNAIAVLEAFKASKGIKGFVIFFECSKVMDDKVAGVVENMKYLQLLMKEFKRYKQSVLFVITKVKDEKLETIGITLDEKIEGIAAENDDEDLRDFCQEIVDSGILKNTMGKRIVIAEPCGSNSISSRNEILEVVKNFSSDTTPPKADTLGYPISEKALTQGDNAKLSNKAHAVTNLTHLKNALKPYWDKKISQNVRPLPSRIQKADVDLALKCLNEIRDIWLTKKASLALFAKDPCYTSVSVDLTDRLSRFLSFWDNFNKINSKQEPVDDDNMEVQYAGIKTELERIRDWMDDIYHQRMHEVNRDTLEDVLQTHAVQGSLPKIKNAVQLSNLMQSDASQLGQILTALDTAIGAKLPYLGSIDKILKKTLHCTELKTIIELNILNTITVSSQNDQITVIAKAKKVALSAIMSAVSGFASVHSLVIQAHTTSSEGTVYFDTNLTEQEFKNVQWITIDADRIEVVGKKRTIKPGVRWIDMGIPIPMAIQIMGKFKGTHNIESRELVLREDAQESSSGIRCVWPL